MSQRVLTVGGVRGMWQVGCLASATAAAAEGAGAVVLSICTWMKGDASVSRCGDLSPLGG